MMRRRGVFETMRPGALALLLAVPWAGGCGDDKTGVTIVSPGDADASVGGGDTSEVVAPSATIQQPTSGASYMPEVAVAFRATVAPGSGTSTGLTYRLESSANDRGNALKLGDVPADGVVAATLEALLPGTQTLTFTVLAGGATVATAEVEITVRSPDAAPTLAIDPSEPTAVDVVAATVSPAGDAAGDAHYRWIRAGVPIGPADAALPAGLTHKGETITLEGWMVSDELASDKATLTFTVANTAPTCSLATLIPSGVATGDKDIVCACAGFQDPDAGDTDQSRCAFYDDADGGALIDTDGSCTLPASQTDKDMVIRCVLTPNDGEDDGGTTASPNNTTSISNLAPTAPEISLAPASADATDDLTCSVTVHSTDPDGDSIAYEVAWYVDGTVVPGVTLATCTGEELDAVHGQSVTCAMRADDGTALSPAATSVAVVLGNAVPALSTVFLSSPHSPPTEADTLTCAPQDGADADHDALSYLYTWSVAGQIVAGATEATLGPDRFARGDSVACTATACDSEGACSATINSKFTYTVANAPPTVTGVVITEVPAVGTPDGNAQADDTLTCTVLGTSDLDGDTVSVIYGFYSVAANGAVTELYSGPNPNYVVPESLPAGTTLYCTATPADASTSGPQAESASFEVLAPNPIPPVVAISAPQGADGDVTCAITTPARWFGSAATTTWYWTINGGAETVGAQVLANADADGCDIVSCRAVVANAATQASSNVATKSLAIGSAGCDDGNPCTLAACKGGGGCNFVVTPGASCDDHDPCSPSSACDPAGACVAQSDICVEDALDVAAEDSGWPTAAALPSGGYLSRYGTVQPRVRLTDPDDTRLFEEMTFDTDAGSQWRTRPAVGTAGRAMVSTWTYDPANQNNINNLSAHILDTTTGAVVKSQHVVQRSSYAGGWYQPVAAESFSFAFSDGSWGLLLNNAYFMRNFFPPVGQPTRTLSYFTWSADLSTFTSAATVASNASIPSYVLPVDARLFPDGSDRFLAAWVAADLRTVKAQLVSKAGAAVLPADLVVTTLDAGKTVEFLRVLPLRNGAFWVAWSYDGADAAGFGVRVQRFTPNGSPDGEAFVATTDESGAQVLGDLGAFSDYGVVLVYADSLIDGAGYGIAAQFINNDGTLEGDPVLLNGRVTGDQTQPSLAVLPGDEWVATWRDASGGQWTRRFDRGGARFGTAFEIPGNDGTFGAQEDPAVATLLTGEILVAFQSDVFGTPDMNARVFDADGVAMTSDVAVSTFGAGSQIQAAATGGASRFLVAWNSQGQDGSVDGVYGRWFDADGAPTGDETLLTTVTAGAQRDPAVAMTWSDDALVAWTADADLSSLTDVKVRAFAADAVPLGGEVVVNATTTAAQEAPAVAAFTSARAFIVAWQSRNQDTDGSGVYLRKVVVSDEGAVSFPTGELRANQTLAGDQQAPTVAVSSIGMVATCWESFGQDGSAPASWGVYCRLFNGTTLAPLAAEFRVHTLVAGDQRRPRLTALGDGRFLVAWETAGLDGRGVAVQSVIFDSSSTLRGARMTANRWWGGDQRRPSVAATADAAVIGWDSSAQDQDGAGVFFRVLPLQ